LATSRRLPSGSEAWLFAGACVSLIHFWAILSFLREVPALLLRMTWWELLAAGAYTLVFALLESLLLFVALLLVAVILPASWLRDSFAIKGALLLCLLLVWLGLGPRLPRHPPWASLLTRVGLLASLGLSYRVLGRKQSVRDTVRDGLERLSLLSYLYLALDVVSLLIVLARNI